MRKRRLWKTIRSLKRGEVKPTKKRFNPKKTLLKVGALGAFGAGTGFYGFAKGTETGFKAAKYRPQDAEINKRLKKITRK